MKRAAPEAEVQGAPELALRDEDVDAIAELVAELLLAALERDGAEEQSA